MEATDFERRMDRAPQPPEGGLSFFREKTTDLHYIVETIKRLRLKNRGLASASVKTLTDLGFKIYGDTSIPTARLQHICIHCDTCDGAENDYKSADGICPFVPPDSFSNFNDKTRILLAQGMDTIFDSILGRTTILETFAKDVSATESVANRNSIYYHRWEKAIKASRI